MFGNFLVNRRKNKYFKMVSSITGLKEKMSEMSTDELVALVKKYKDANSKQKPMSLAAVRELGQRKLGLFAYDVQMVGVLATLDGYVLDMKTGEGKTLVCALSAALLASKFDVVRVATANDYLVKRDAEFVTPLFEALDVSVGNSPDVDAQVQYSTLNSFCIYWLRDHTVDNYDNVTHKNFNNPEFTSAIIVDEIDLTLIDSSTVPHSITDRVRSDVEVIRFSYTAARKILEDNPDILIEEDGRVIFAEDYYDKIEKVVKGTNLNLLSQNADLMFAIKSNIYALGAMKQGIDYVVKGDVIYRLDKRSGRIFANQFKEEMLNALQLKEGVSLTTRTASSAMSTIPNYIKRYTQISGMSGSAFANHNELSHIYDLDVMELPTNKEKKTKNLGYRVFATQAEKVEHALEFASDKLKNGQPVLLACESDAQSDLISRTLIEKGVGHTLLNSKNIEREKEIFGEAGSEGKLTVTTRVCGRGTDILIEDKEVESKGGLVVIGLSAGETIVDDIQLSGRTGRQGANGMVVMLTSLEDDIFVGNYAAQKGLTRFLYTPDIDPTVTEYLAKSVANVQAVKQSSLKNQRKQLMLFDKPMAKHLDILYGKRMNYLCKTSFVEDAKRLFGEEKQVELKDYIDTLGEEKFNEIYRGVYLSALSHAWRAHCTNMINARDEAFTVAGNGIFKYQEKCQELLADFASSFERFVGEQMPVIMEKESMFIKVSSKFLNDDDMRSIGSVEY
ncbi:hypothetical protein [Vibrio crassostreae]|uniref:preprotein translocase subunit SecA n=1 Tax=Vibrio crassostreae TaxID=246167 RepID=UPI001B3012D6|nr:hypothetical protein [Vibrio crassostreae]